MSTVYLLCCLHFVSSPDVQISVKLRSRHEAAGGVTSMVLNPVLVEGNERRTYGIEYGAVASMSQNLFLVECAERRMHGIEGGAVWR